jgi:hypothetical protein
MKSQNSGLPDFTCENILTWKDKYTALISNLKLLKNDDIYGKVKVKLYLCLTKYHAMKLYPLLN